MSLGISLGLERRLDEITHRVRWATAWPWRAYGGSVVAPRVPQHDARTAQGRFGEAVFHDYGGELVCESVDGPDARLIERAPEDLAFLVEVARSLLADRERLVFLLESRYSCGSREEVDHLMATAGKPWEPLSIVPTNYEIVDETKAGAA